MKKKCPQKTIYHIWNDISLNFPVTEKCAGEESVIPLFYQYTNSYPRQKNSMESHHFFFLVPWIHDLLGCSVCVTVMLSWQCKNSTALSCKPLKWKASITSTLVGGTHANEITGESRCLCLGKKRIYLEFTNSKLFLAKIFFSKQLFGGFLSFHRWVSRCKENERFEA